MHTLRDVIEGLDGDGLVITDELKTGAGVNLDRVLYAPDEMIPDAVFKAATAAGRASKVPAKALRLAVSAAIRAERALTLPRQASEG